MRNQLRLHNGTLQRRDYRLRSPKPVPPLLRYAMAYAAGVLTPLLAWYVCFGVIAHG